MLFVVLLVVVGGCWLLLVVGCCWLLLVVVGWWLVVGCWLLVVVGWFWVAHTCFCPFLFPSGVCGPQLNPEQAISLITMHHGDVNRAATWYLSHGHEAFLEKQEELEEQAALALSMGENGETKQELNALSTEKELFVVVSLEEAQSLRRAMQKHPVLRHAIALYTPDGLNLTPARKEESKKESKKESKEESKEPLVPAPVKLLRQTTAEVVLPMTNPSPLDLACQVTKFFNSQLWYTDTEVVWVLMSLDDSAESERRVAFEGNCCYQLLSIALRCF